MYQSTPGMTLIQNNVMCGVDRNGAEFIGNKQTYTHLTLYIITDKATSSCDKLH